ncbi:hypothetical protein ACXR0O_04915 [Verrucomicrobiota bacterium sgz303538]
MKTLTNDACSEWLAARGIAEAPYGRSDGSRWFYVQLPLPDTPQRISYVNRCLAGLFSLAICYQWTAYLYLDYPATFLCWEGELLDCWVFDRSQLAAIQEIFQPNGPSANPIESA